MVQGLCDVGKLVSGQLDGVVKAILQRETLGSTGMGNGLAIPHTKHEGVPETTGVVAVSQEGVDFASLDGDPVHVFFLLVSPSETPDSMSAPWRQYPDSFAMAGSVGSRGRRKELRISSNCSRKRMRTKANELSVCKGKMGRQNTRSKASLV